MKPWPDFDSNGDLPVDVYEATLEETIERFGGGTLQRRLVAQRLRRIYSLAVSTGQLARFIIFGSFVTSKSAPNDIDIFMIMKDTFDLNQESGEAAIIFYHRPAQNWEGASIFWIRQMASIGGAEEAVKDWQVKRDGSRRGIVEVIAND